MINIKYKCTYCSWSGSKMELIKQVPENGERMPSGCAFVKHINICPSCNKIISWEARSILDEILE